MRKLLGSALLIVLFGLTACNEPSEPYEANEFTTNPTAETTVVEETTQPIAITEPATKPPREPVRTLTYDEVDFDFRMYSTHALLFNLDTGEVLFSHEADTRAYPGSMTKILTVLIDIDTMDLDKRIPMYFDGPELIRQGALESGFFYGEVRSIREILTAIMVPSGAEATWAFANYMSDTYEGFAAMMNEKAQEIGMHDSNFVSSIGLHDPNHYSTPNDFAKLIKYALEIPFFREMFLMRDMPLETPNSRGDVLPSTLFGRVSDTTFEGGELFGGKTGFTAEGGRCLTSIATNGEHEFIMITFGASDAENTIGHILDHLRIYEYFFNR